MNNSDEIRPIALDDVPLLAEHAVEHRPVPTGAPATAEPFGIFSARDVAERSTFDPDEVDWADVVELRRRASSAITEEADVRQRQQHRSLSRDDHVLMGRAIIRRVVGDHVRTLHRDGAQLWSTGKELAYVQAVEDAVFGYGRLQPLLQLPDVENIEIHGCDSVVVQYGDGRRRMMPPVADTDEELVEAIRFLGQNSQPSRPFDDTHPTMTIALGERFRLHAIGFGLSYRPSVVIRQHLLTQVSLVDLADAGMMPAEVARFLDAAVLARKSMVIAGDQGAGKTTLLRALINSIPFNERFGTLETDYELMTHLQPGRENILALQARTGHGEISGGTSVGEFGISDLMPEALRQNLSRLIVGEVRGGEAAAMFEAMQAGARVELVCTLLPPDRDDTSPLERMSSQPELQLALQPTPAAAAVPPGSATSPRNFHGKSPVPAPPTPAIAAGHDRRRHDRSASPKPRRSNPARPDAYRPTRKRDQCRHFRPEAPANTARTASDRTLTTDNATSANSPPPDPRQTNAHGTDQRLRIAESDPDCRIMLAKNCRTSPGTGQLPHTGVVSPGPGLSQERCKWLDRAQWAGSVRMTGTLVDVARPTT